MRKWEWKEGIRLSPGFGNYSTHVTRSECRNLQSMCVFTYVFNEKYSGKYSMSILANTSYRDKGYGAGERGG